MTTEEINIAIAESWGWTEIESYYFNWDGPPQLCWNGIPNTKEHQTHRIFETVPNCHGDLNACAEFEKTFSDQASQHDYLNNLGEVCKPHVTGSWEDYYPLIVATAPQRCEAYLRTIGKWKEGA